MTLMESHVLPLLSALLAVLRVVSGVTKEIAPQFSKKKDKDEHKLSFLFFF